MPFWVCFKYHKTILTQRNSNQTATSGVCGGLIATMQYMRHKKGLNCKIGLMTPFYTYHLLQIREVLERDPIFVETNADFSVNWENVEVGEIPTEFSTTLIFHGFAENRKHSLMD